MSRKFTSHMPEGDKDTTKYFVPAEGLRRGSNWNYLVEPRAFFKAHPDTTSPCGFHGAADRQLIGGC
jgi:hypothetical protein